MAMAGTNDNTSRIARSAALTLVISVAVLYLGDRLPGRRSRASTPSHTLVITVPRRRGVLPRDMPTRPVAHIAACVDRGLTPS